MEKYFYKVPRIFREGQHGYRLEGGFELSNDFAVRARERPLEEKEISNLQSLGEEMIQNIFPGNGRITPYNFIENSSLLYFITTPGKRSNLHLNFESKEYFSKFDPSAKPNLRSIVFETHNLDFYDQAVCMLNLFLTWTAWADIYVE